MTYPVSKLLIFMPLNIILERFCLLSYALFIGVAPGELDLVKTRPLQSSDFLCSREYITATVVSQVRNLQALGSLKG